MPKILLLGGPSGSGKSTFSAQYLAAAHNWLHLEIDRWPEIDGIDHYGIRAEWNRFLEQNDPIPLHEVLRQRAIGHAGLVLSLPSPIVFDSQHLHAALGLFHFAYLYGHPAVCLQAFLDSPKAIQAGLGADHWNFFNSATFGALSRSENHPLLIHSFTTDGVRRSDDEIYNDLVSLLDEAS